MKGKKIWLYTDKDIYKMYERYHGKPSIRLWSYATPKSGTSKPVKESTRLHQEKKRNRKKLMKFMKNFRKSTRGHIVLNSYVPGLT